MEKNTRKSEAASTNPLKVVLFGPESTGKTTLAKALAEWFETFWVPEYMREYLQQKWDATQTPCQKQDLIPIAEGQIAAEEAVISKPVPVLFLDTNVLQLQVYYTIYYDGYVPDLVKDYMESTVYDHYFLTYIDTPWEADDLRDKPGEREEMFQAFEAMLQKTNQKYTLLKGDLQERLSKAKTIVERLLNEKKHVY